MEIIFENIQKKMFSFELLTLFILIRLGYYPNNLNPRYIKKPSILQEGHILLGTPALLPRQMQIQKVFHILDYNRNLN